MSIVGELDDASGVGAAGSLASGAVWSGVVAAGSAVSGEVGAGGVTGVVFDGTAGPGSVTGGPPIESTEMPELWAAAAAVAAGSP